MKRLYKMSLLAIVAIMLMSCKKSSYLDAIPNQSLVIPEALSDFQAILDNDNLMNGNNLYGGLTPFFGEVGCDDYYVISTINNLSQDYLNLYKWDDNIYSGGGFNQNWSLGYRGIFYSNLVLDGLAKLKNISVTQQSSYNRIKGSAFFYRAYIYYQLAQVFAPLYNQATANAELGLPLRLTSDINESILRASLEQTYDRIIQDLKESLLLLPDKPQYKTRPSKHGAYALLARIHLSIGNFESALLYSDSSLQIDNNLLDYNVVNPLDGGPYSFPFSRFNSEVIFSSIMIGNPIVLPDIGRVDSFLFSTYDPNDLRKKLFFSDRQGGYSFRGSYDNTYSLFSGLATDEVYLIRAECYARTGDMNKALSDLNTLLEKRWINNGSWTPISATDTNDALEKILIERRKELLFRGIRWTDLRRLNKEGANITIRRILNGQEFSLSPNSPKYTYLIPPDVIGFNPGMPQNVR